MRLPSRPGPGGGPPEPDAEQIAGVESHALRVLVGQLAGVGFVWTDDDLGDRFDGRGAPRLNVDEGIAIFEADRGHHAQGLGVSDGQEVRNARLVGNRGVDGIGADACKRRPDFARGIGE